jgi:hypothetical protein
VKPAVNSRAAASGIFGHKMPETPTTQPGGRAVEVSSFATLHPIRRGARCEKAAAFTAKAHPNSKAVEPQRHRGHKGKNKFEQEIAKNAKTRRQRVYLLRVHCELL